MTEKLLAAIDAAGADVIELGVPFSDPMADGPVIQAASQRALAAGTTLPKILAMAQRLKGRLAAPLVLFSTAVLLYVGLRGRSVKEAQANLSVLLFAASILPVAQMFMRRKDPEWLLSVPIAGQYALLSRVLRGDALVFHEWLQAFAVPALLAAVALQLTARLLSKESVLAGR